jgi:hypothetical protein
MTFAAIEAKGKELQKKERALSEMLSLAEKLHVAIDKIQKSENQLRQAIDELFEKKHKLLPLVEKLDTQKIKELQQIKDNMIAICSGRTTMDRLLPLGPAKNVVDKAAGDYNRELYDWLAKQRAAMPKVFKKGMVFNDRTKDRVYEMLADEAPIADKDLKNGQRVGSILLKTRYKDNKMLSEGVRIEEELTKLEFTMRQLEYVKL